MMNLKHLPLIALITFSIGLFGCNDASDHTAMAVEEVEDPRGEPDYNGKYPDEFGYRKPEWPVEIRKEIYGDPEIFSTPRIQFMAKLKGDKRYKKQSRTLWSMRFDGSDRRQVVDPELLFDGAGFGYPPVRSPNNRYLAAGISKRVDNKSVQFRGIIDLKTKEKWKIIEGAGYPHFNWTSDSENLIFYNDGEHYNYHVPTKTLTKRPIIYSRGLFLLPGDKEFLAFTGYGYRIHQFDGTLIREVDIPFIGDRPAQRPNVSPDGRYLHFRAGSGRGWIGGYVFDIAAGEQINFGHEERLGRFPSSGFFCEPTLLCSFSSGGNFYDLHNMEARKFELDETLIWSLTSFEGITVYNLQATQGGSE